MFLNKTVIGDCPMLLIKAIYRRRLKQFIEDCPMLLNKAVYRRLSNAFE